MEVGNINIAYILLVHKNPEQVNLFLQQILQDENSEVYIHIDKKNVEFINDRIMKHPRVNILKNSINGSWGDISLVDATIILLQAVIDSGKKYDFVCLRSGQDLIVKNGYKEYLAKNKEKSFMTVSKIKKSSSYAAFVNVKWPKVTRRLYNNMHPFRILRSLLKFLYGIGINISPNRDRLPENFSLYDGSQWFTISTSLARYIVDYLYKNPWYYKAFKNTLVPDTWFFQTLVKNSPFAHTVVNVNHVYMRWGETLRDINHPVNITASDIYDIERTDNYFARKFDENIDNEVISYFHNKIVKHSDRISSTKES